MRPGASVLSLLGSSLLCVVLGATGIGVHGAGPVAAQPAQADAAAVRPQVWGYYPAWLHDHWRSRDLSLYDRLKFFEVEIDSEGRLGNQHGWPERWEDLRGAARSRGLPVDLTVTLFSVSRFERVFGNAQRRQRLLDELLRGVGAVQGVHLDVEIFQGVSADALRGYRAFCAALRKGLKRQGADKVLSAFAVMGAVVDLYDRATLAQLDYIVVQGYDSHHLDSPHAGPVAPLRGPYAITWEKTLAHYLALGAPRHRIAFGVPFYGYEWPTETAAIGARTLGKGREITYAMLDARLLPDIRTDARSQAALHGLRRDPASGSPYYAHADASGAWRQGWFEDEVSLAAKFEFVKQQRLAGIAIFPVGYDGGAFDDLLRRSFREK
jgi:spore germination protein YaaH